MNDKPMVTDIQKARIMQLNSNPITEGEYVLYWMQASQRATDNLALDYAIQKANELAKPVLVCFGLMDGSPEANLRHYAFMLEGLKETIHSLKGRNIKLVVQRGSPDEVAIKLAKDACLVVADRGYLRIQKAWRNSVANRIACSCVQVEDNVIVPVNLVSDKQEYAARTLRPKIHKHIEDFLVDHRSTAVAKSSLSLAVASLDLSNLESLLQRLKLDRSVESVGLFKGGTSQAKTIFKRFIEMQFANYDANRNQPQTNDVSHMGMYLHFGQISPLYLAMQVRFAQVEDANKDSYIEELIVRRELAMNFVNFCDDYDNYDCLPAWAAKTLEEHKGDRREYIYTRDELEKGQTHDPYWNAAMDEMRYTGYMHNYMRMYWGKKIIEWTPLPLEAFQTALYLNNKYFIDGRDANSFTGIAWCFGLHDRPWTERSIFGKVRYMNANGLKRKAKPDAYVAKVEALVRQAHGPNDGPASPIE